MSFSHCILPDVNPYLVVTTSSIYLRLLCQATYSKQKTVVLFDGSTASQKSDQNSHSPAGNQNKRPRADKGDYIETSGVAHLGQNEDPVVV